MEKCKPIKRSKAFVQFSKEHHYGLLLAWKIRQDLTKVIPADEISRYVLDFFRDDLKQHFTDEEKYIFSKLSAADPLRQRAESEHRDIYNLIESIHQNSTDKRLLLQFADLLETHIRFEERTLFNHLQQQMSTEELEQLLLNTAGTETACRSNKLFDGSK
jgi:hemerythrin-like domain-containing protein